MLKTDNRPEILNQCSGSILPTVSYDGYTLWVYGPNGWEFLACGELHDAGDPVGTAEKFLNGVRGVEGTLYLFVGHSADETHSLRYAARVSK